MLVEVVVAVAAGCGGREESSARSAPGVLLEIDVVTGARLLGSAAVVGRLSGPTVPPDPLLEAASCHNVRDWLDDATLDNSIVVGSNPRLVRVAELVAGGRFDDRLALGVEEQFWRESGIVLSRHLVDAGFSQNDLDLYLAALAEQPSVAAADRFVVYAVSEMTKRLRVTYLDTTTMPEPRTVSRLGEQRVYLASDQDLYRAVVERSACEAMQSAS